MRPSILFGILTTTIIACGDDAPTQPDGPKPEIDAAPDAPQPPGTAITVETDTVAPSLIAYRDGNGPWQSAKMIDVDTFELDVHGPYIVTVVCDDTVGDITTWQVARTPDDDAELFLPCSGLLSETHPVTGQMVQAGTVTLGFFTDRSQTTNWSFSIDAENGTKDLFAFNASRIAARRDLIVSGDTAVTPAVDLRQGVALVAAPLVAPNATADETVVSAINIFSGNQSFVRLFRGAASDTKVAPGSFLLVTDRQSAAVTARGVNGNSRTLRRGRFAAGDPAEFTLPEPFGGVAYVTSATNQLEAHWNTLPEHDIVDVSLDAFTEDFSTFFFHDLEISAAYIAATGVTSMKLDTEIPDYRPEWRIDYTKEYNRTISALDFRATESATSTITETVNAPPALTRVERARPAKLERVLSRRELLRDARR
ncbi:MAG TPA: hypothetical protein VFQ53_14245 [Kofleriaceae bacterium]|nr:hypothetical protein [Kofleriaceae bacterium]